MSNPYASPATSVDINYETAAEVELAGRGERLAAVLINGLINMIAMIPLAIIMIPLVSTLMEHDAQGTEPSKEEMMQFFSSGFSISMFAITGFLALAITIWNIVLLAKRGQSLGKYLMKVQIVRAGSYEKASMVNILALRWFVMSLINQIPFIGPLVSLINPFFIFRDDRRCLHDLVADTAVIKYQEI